MRCSAYAVLLGLSVLLVSAVAQAQDTVSIRYLPGHPLPNRSSEWVDIRVERMGSAVKGDAHEIDRFFASVEATLTKYRIVRDWQMVIPDAPSIEITIDLHGQRTRLASAHVPAERSGKHVVTERGVEALNQRTLDSVLAQQSKEFREHRLAFEKLLELTLQRMRGNLAP